jgi:hypothetical protein
MCCFVFTYTFLPSSAGFPYVGELQSSQSDENVGMCQVCWGVHSV